MNIPDIVLRIAIYMISFFEIALALYVLFLDWRDITNRHLSAALGAFAIIGFGTAAFMGAETAAQAAIPSYIVAVGSAAINPLIFLAAIALTKPAWFAGRRRWPVWLLYGLAILPLALLLVDLFSGSKLWYTGLDPAAYQGGFVSRTEYYNGPLYPWVAAVNSYTTPIVVVIYLVFVAFFDKTISDRRRRIGRILLLAQILVFAIFAIRLPVPAFAHLLTAILIFDISYTILALSRLVSGQGVDRALSRISLRRRLQVGFGGFLVVLLLIGIGLSIVAIRIQLLLAQLLALDLDSPEVIALARTTIDSTRITLATSAATAISVIFFIVIVGGIATYVLGRQIIEAIQNLQQSAQKLGVGDLTARVDVMGTDEIAVMSQAFNVMADRLAEVLGELEQKVQERAQTLEISAEISRQLAAIVELDELLQYSVNRIRDGFDLYYTHIYLVEEGTGDLVMMDGSGEVGKLLKAKGHRLKSGEGIVGTVASLDEYFMSNNVHEAINWVPNVLLPDTNSELAVPLRKGDLVLGVLDVQSDQVNRFTAEDVTTLQSLANQIAAAVDNARLLEETRTALQEVERLNRRLTRESWKEFEEGVTTSGYRFVGEGVAAVQPASDLWFPQMQRAAATKRVVKQLQPGNGDPARSEMAVPLILRGEVIGALGIKREEASEWTSEEEAIVGAVADQVARALESARLSEEQAKTIGQLQEVDRLKTGFLTSMSHELRTPLNSIIGFADILLQGIDGPLTDNAITDITAIHGSGKHLLALINDILDLSKIDAGRMELVYSAVSVPIIFREVAASVSSLLKEKPVRLVQKADYELPKIWADPLRFSQIVINLVSNAVKFTEEGVITMGAEVFNPIEMHIYVQDTGIGIPEDKIDLVFESFRQVDARNNRKYQGTGMGLAISKQLVEIHGGQMWVESTLGEGTIFHFTIGLAPEDEQVSG